MSNKHFTYKVACSFNMQFTFPESDVEQSDEGDEGDMSPTDSALEALGKEIEECVCERFGGVANVEVSADFDELLGVDEDELLGETDG
jgi:hypothetical protein